MRVLLPWFRLVLFLLVFGRVVVEGIAGRIEEFDFIRELWAVLLVHLIVSNVVERHTPALQSCIHLAGCLVVEDWRCAGKSRYKAVIELYT
jgi:hypothetical protein